MVPGSVVAPVIADAYAFYNLYFSEGYEELARARGEGTSSPLASADDFDMFADDDAANKPSTDENNAVSEPSSDAINSGKEGGALQSDYVYDESSG
ncbi:CD2 antigen cytoplasmic tail-binding protein, partial [Trifolium medium]|nr:CD2 antigen cytoplasmic tail-binding protein [Trifolium medium]